MDPTKPESGSPRQPVSLTRRLFFERLGWFGMALFALVSIPGAIRFFRPPRGAAGAGVFDAGTVAEYAGQKVSTRWIRKHRLWVVRDAGGLYALIARCTHLGCTPRWDAHAGLFQCPCHGSQFSPEGAALKGPARDPLRRAAIWSEEGRLYIDARETRTLDEAEGVPGFYVRL
jgi:cytochrome b6-f complex iron-sulfur subunit